MLRAGLRGESEVFKQVPAPLFYKTNPPLLYQGEGVVE